jgi:voltage-gated potassium channel
VDSEASPWRRVIRGGAVLALVLTAGTIGYIAYGLSVVDAIYQTVTTVTTVGFREMGDFGTGEKVLTIAVIVLGVGTALYTFSAVVEAVVEGQVSETVRRRRMQRRIADMSDHVIVCGWGRVGKTVAEYAKGYGMDVVVIDNDPDQLAETERSHVVGDATVDSVLVEAGIDRARALVAALAEDADNLFVTLTARGLNPKLFIVARARVASSEAKLLQAGADRVVNPQQLGGARMAAFANQPHVAEFLDVVMHDGHLDYRLEEVVIPSGSPVAGRTLREAQLRDRTGALVLATRDRQGEFRTNPGPDDRLDAETVLIVIGTEAQLTSLGDLVTGH